MHNLHFPSVLVCHMLWWGTLTRPALAFPFLLLFSACWLMECLTRTHQYSACAIVLLFFLCVCVWAGWGREAPRFSCFICKLCKQKAFTAPSALWQCRLNRSLSSFQALLFSLPNIPFAALVKPKWHCMRSALQLLLLHTTKLAVQSWGFKHWTSVLGPKSQPFCLPLEWLYQFFCIELQPVWFLWKETKIALISFATSY